MKTRWPLLAMALPGLAGCAVTNPEQRIGDWHPTQINAANLATMVADPRDLARGEQPIHPDGQLALDAVARLRAGKVKALPASETSQVLGAGSGATQQGGATAEAAGQ